MVLFNYILINTSLYITVTRDGLVSPSGVRQPIQKPTCPPNATVQAEFQTFNVNSMLKNGELVSFEEELVKTKYPLLASIIIGNSTYKEQKQEKSWEQGNEKFISYKYLFSVKKRPIM